MGRAPYFGIEKSRIIQLNPPKSKIDFFRQGLGGESPWCSALSLPLAAAWVCGVGLQCPEQCGGEQGLDRAVSVRLDAAGTADGSQWSGPASALPAGRELESSSMLLAGLPLVNLGM